MGMAEDELAVAVEEVGNALRPHLGGEGLDDGKARRQRRRLGAFPDRGEAVEQEAEGALRIGVAHRRSMKGSQWLPPAGSGSL